LSSPKRALTYLVRGFRRFGWRAIPRLCLDAELVKLGGEVVHFEFGALAPSRMYLADLLGCRMVVSFRGYDLNYVGLDVPNYYAEVWEKAAVLHFLGEDLWKRAQRRGCSPGKPHRLIPPAVDTTLFNPGERGRAAHARPLRILSVGRLEWKKGYEHALVAIRALCERGVECEYRIVGGGGYLGGLAFARHQLGLEGVVTFLGPLSHEGVREQMRTADIFLHAAVSEGFCNAVMEAQAMELPIVCTDADGLPENVEHGATGFVVPRRNPLALADALAVLAGDGALRRRMGRAGRRRVAARFRPDDQIEAFEELYKTVLAGDPGGHHLVEPHSSRVPV
jgi:colanic acid/amylovoran biosynthesis glycosyltransferase